MANEDLMTLSQYAADRKRRKLPGATLQSVLNACNSGRIPYQTIGKNRFVDPTIADRSWLMNTDLTRYSADQLAALHGEPPAPVVDSPQEVGAGVALETIFMNAAVVGACLMRDLNLEPLPALRAAVNAVSTLNLCVAELLHCESYLSSAVPSWAMALLEGQHDDPDLAHVLANTSAMATELFQEESPPPPDDDLTAILTADLKAHGII